MKIIIIDDDLLVAMSLKTILESDKDIEVICTGKNGKEAVELYEKYCPDVMLMDIQMKEMNGLEAAERIIENNAEAKIILLTTFLDNEYILKALQVGAKGYILKQDFEGILPALYAVCQGQSVFGEKIVHKIPELMKTNDVFDFNKYGINEKEHEIIVWVAKGYSNKEISEELYLSEGTVRNYISSILEKLSLRDRTQLAIYYYQNIKR
ncbi:response regulator transcription factor [uncultured Eubacterium sp.]|uniref:response regulator transcription factor n=1 Tax=uncultured Eubacterium sp. TaxID=165185 RepID=UPI00267136BD|nr:response regulator transcription factor [uncultured Eubacterium sp.]